MANAIGSLVVRLSLDAAEFTSGLQKSEKEAKQFAKNLEQGIATAARFAGAAMLAAAGAAVIMARDIIADAAALDDLSDATGSSVENLSKLANQAKISGTDFQTLQGLVLKLTAGMAGADDESSNVGRALKFLGVTAKDPAQALQEVAVALNKYADGTGKAALARDLFGKGGPAFLATLKDIAELQDVAATTSTKMAAEAEKLEKSWRSLSAQGTLLKNTILGDIVPSLNEMIENFKSARKEGEGFIAALNSATADNDMDRLGQRIESLQKRLKQMRDDVGSYKGSILPEWMKPTSQKELAAAEAQLKSLTAIQGNFFRRQAEGAAEIVPGKPRPDYTGAKDKDAKAAAKGIDEGTRALESFAKMSASASLELAGLLMGQEKTTAAMKKLAELEASDAWKTFSGEVQTAIRGAAEHASAIELETEALRKSQEQHEKNIKALQDMADAETKARDAARANVASYADQNKVLERQLAIVGQDELAHQKLAAALEYERDRRKALDAGALDAVATLDKEYATRIKLLEAFDAANKAHEKVLEAQREQKQFVDSLTRSFEDQFTAVLDGTKSVKDAFKDLGKAWVHEINAMAAKQLGKALFGDINDSAGGIGGLIGKVLGLFSGTPDMSWMPTPGYASGTNFARGGLSLVGERGPEIVNIPRGAQVIPNHELMARRAQRDAPSITINTTVMPGVTRQSSAQAGAEMLRNAMRAQRIR